MTFRAFPLSVALLASLACQGITKADESVRACKSDTTTTPDLTIIVREDTLRCKPVKK
jgi:hypothetical protein